MTTRSRSSLKAQARGKLTLGKITLRDLTVPGAGPKGGQVRAAYTNSCLLPASYNCPATMPIR